MISRIVRIFFVVMLAAFVAITGASQLWGWRVGSPQGLLYAFPTGFMLDGNMTAWWYFQHEYVGPGPWLIRDLVPWKRLHCLFLPWWVIIVVWGSITLVAWKSTRRRKLPRGAFPVEVEVGKPIKPRTFGRVQRRRPKYRTLYPAHAVANARPVN